MCHIEKLDSCSHKKLQLAQFTSKNGRPLQFNVSSGDVTGTHCFKKRFYGLTDMLAEFQKEMGTTPMGLSMT